MTVRVLLLALVATLGVDLGDLTPWVDSGRGWIVARMPGWPTLESLAETRKASATACDATPGRVDLAFEAAAEAMTSEFRADLALVPSEPVAVAEVEVARGSRLDKISEAVRITRRAVDAWSEVIQPVVEPAPPEDRADSF